MFGGDPFGNPFAQMQRQMRDMDNMMNAMMGGDIFGMSSGFMGQPRQQSILGSNQSPHNNMMMNPFNPFGGNPLGSLMRNVMNDPNAMVMSQSTMISYDGTGAPKVVQSSLRKVGDVEEKRKSFQNGEKAKMTLAHSIGNRSHIIEKKRDKEGRVRQQQKFVNLDTEEAEDFNNEFKTRAANNLGLIFGTSSGTSRKALENGVSGRHSGNHGVNKISNSSGPIVTVPDDDEDDDIQYIEPRGRRSDRNYDSEEEEVVVSSNSRNGPTIREISDEEDENPKRRKGLMGKFFRNGRD